MAKTWSISINKRIVSVAWASNDQKHESFVLLYELITTLFRKRKLRFDGVLVRQPEMEGKEVRRTGRTKKKKRRNETLEGINRNEAWYTLGRKSLFSITRNDFNALPTKGNNLAADKNRVDVIATHQFKSSARDNDLCCTGGRERERCITI